MDGKIITLEENAPVVFAKDYTTMMQLATDMYGVEEE